MKKRLSVLFAGLLCITCILISGCDDAQQTPYIPNNIPGTPSGTTSHEQETVSLETIESTVPDDGRTIPFSKMKEDMSAREEIQNFHTSDFVTESAYVVTDLVLEKEQVSSDGKQTTSYSNIIAQNEYFVSSLRVRTVYNFYDYGGWIMDEFSIEQIDTVSPLRVPNEDCVMTYLKNDVTSITSTDKHNHDTEFNTEKDNLTLESTELDDHYARFHLLVENPVMKLNCYIIFEHGEDGWKSTTCHTKSVQYDYSMALGSFAGEFSVTRDRYNDEGKGSIQILSITENKAIVNIDYCYWEYYGIKATIIAGQGIECDFFPATGSIKLNAQYSTGYDTEVLSYDPITDTWKNIGIRLTRTSD